MVSNGGVNDTATGISSALRFYFLVTAAYGGDRKGKSALHSYRCCSFRVTYPETDKVSGDGNLGTFWRSQERPKFQHGSFVFVVR